MTSPQYKLETVARACSILRLFADERQALTLKQVVELSGLEQTICFRLLVTLESEGLLRKADGKRYSSNVRLLKGTRYRIGYASQGLDSFSSAVSQGIRWASTEHQVDLIELGNHYSIKTAIRNAELFIRRELDLVIEFQTYERIGPRLSQMFAEAGIPLIALEIPHPNATFVGLDNHRVGMLAGKTLLKAAQRQWQGTCDEVIFLDLEIAGSVPSLRLSTAESVLRHGLVGPYAISHLQSHGEFTRSFEVARKHLRSSRAQRVLLTGVNDFAVLGALRAFEEAGRGNYCLAVSIGGGPEARRELRLSSSHLHACVAAFPERYGESVIQLAIDILDHRSTPPAVYMPVQVLHAKNVNAFYPKDIFSNSGDGDSHTR
jgi:ribose transport system substrate-binding protein